MTAQAPHDMAAEVRSVRIESEIARRGIKLSAGITERCGPCPVCGGTDRFSVNLKKQVWNCRKCERGGDIIELVRHLDGLSFGEAVSLLTGAAAQKPAPSARHGNGDARKAQEPARDAPYNPRAAFEWTYQDETGAPLFRSVRTPEKQFWQSPADGHGGWVKPSKGCMDGVRLVPLYLPEVLAAIRNSGLILISEGERKADLLRHWGFVATCNVSGAIRSKLWFDHAKEFFSAGCYGPKIIVLPDNDYVGRKHADTIGAAFAAVGVTVHILALPVGEKEDVLNWYDRGGTREQLHALIENEARSWEPSECERVNAAAADHGAGKKAAKAETFLIRASEIAPEPIAWLWKYWLARGKLHIIAGAPGGGKTTIYLSFAAIISAGATWPDGTRAKAGNVLIWTTEDGHADTIIPRLTRMGADLDRIFIVRSQREANGKTRAFNPSTDMESLREKAVTISGGVDFVFLDPVISAVPVTRNSDKNAETRAGLTPFVDFAIELNAAAGGVTHVSKWTTGKEPLERVTGTLAYGAVPRIVLLTSINKAEGDGEPERVMVRVKNNVGPCDGGFGFHIDTAPLLERPDVEATRIVWELPLEGTAIELMNAAEGETAKVSKLDEAKRFLRAALARGERSVKELQTEAETQNISWRTIKRASEAGEIGKRKDGFGGWFWWLS